MCLVPTSVQKKSSGNPALSSHPAASCFEQRQLANPYSFLFVYCMRRPLARLSRRCYKAAGAVYSKRNTKTRSEERRTDSHSISTSCVISLYLSLYLNFFCHSTFTKNLPFPALLSCDCRIFCQFRKCKAE
jgi:hypothetical protein